MENIEEAKSNEASEEMKKTSATEKPPHDSGAISEEENYELSEVTDLEKGAQEQKDEASKKAKEVSETEKHVEGGTISQEINAEPSVVKDLDEKDEPNLSNSSNDKLLHPASQLKSHLSIDQYPFRSSTVSSMKHEHEGKHGPILVSRRTGKTMCDNFNQTSLIWEKKPLAEILRPTPKTPPNPNPNPEKDEMGAEDKITTSVGDVENNKPSSDNSQALEEDKSQRDDELPEREESNLSPLQPQIKESQESIPYSIATQGETYYGPDSLQPEALRTPFNPDQSPEDKKSKQPQPTETERDNQIWISQKTGKEVKSNFNQTSLIWEKKPLAEILHRTKAVDKRPDPDESQLPVD